MRYGEEILDMIPEPLGDQYFEEKGKTFKGLHNKDRFVIQVGRLMKIAELTRELLREFDTPVPDLTLRVMYKERIRQILSELPLL